MNPSVLSLSRTGSNAAIGLSYATVTGRAEKWLFLSAGGGRALRADSCLLEPECGDTVLVCDGGEKAVSYVLAVLSRAQRDSASLCLPGDVALHTEQGCLMVQAPKRLALQSPEIAMAALSGDMKFQRLNVSVQQTEARFGTAKLVAKTLNSTIGQLLQKARDSFRWIENLDETRATRVSIQASERYSLATRNAAILAERQVKIDGKKIDLG